MSSAETEAVLDRCATVRNDIKAKKRAVNLLKKADRDALENEKKGEQAKIMRAHAMPWLGIDQKEIIASNQRIRDIEQQLESQSPLPYVPPETRDAINNRIRQLDDEIRQGMPSREDMRRNPPGMVDQHIKWEKANKDKILERKNLKRQLEPESEERDLANIEMIRPEKAMLNGASTFMVDAQIPGHFAQTPQAKANWPQGFGENVNSALEQVRNAEAAPEPEKKHKYPPRTCACGCGQAFLPSKHNQKYIRDHNPAYQGIKRGQQVGEKIECRCGCRETFVPKYHFQRFVNKEHKDRFHNKRKQERAVAMQAGEE